jgi:hypothetical protein
MEEKDNVVPFANLKKIASSIAQTQNAKGAVVITLQENGTVNIGASNVESAALRYALNVGIYHTFIMDLEKGLEGEEGQ